ncbi:MAG: hypothetical protein AAF741_04330 [Bacteroidota bacterium]
MIENNNESTPNWLKSLERSSWQIEVLISGGLVLTLFNLPSKINEALLGAFLHTSFDTPLFIIFIAAFVVSKALLIGFGVNLFLRAIWLALLGVNFAYPKGIDFERLDYSETFKEEMNRRPSTLDRILWLERWSSLSYSLAIILTVGALGAVLVVALIYYLIIDPFFSAYYSQSEWFGYLVLFLIGLFSFGFVDKLMFRSLRKKPKATKRYFRLSRILGTFNLTRFLRRESLTIVSNNRRWRIHLLYISYFIIAIFVSLQDLELQSPLRIKLEPFDARAYREVPLLRFELEEDDYNDQLRPGQLVEEASIPSEVIHGNTLPLFVTYDQYMDANFDYLVDSFRLPKTYYDTMDIEDFRDATKLVQRSLNDMFYVRIDGNEVDSLRWFYKKHPVSNQEGFYTRIGIDTLSTTERHDLVISYLKIRDPDPDTIGLNWIAFWREKN